MQLHCIIKISMASDSDTVFPLVVIEHSGDSLWSESKFATVELLEMFDKTPNYFFVICHKCLALLKAQICAISSANIQTDIWYS